MSERRVSFGGVAGLALLLTAVTFATVSSERSDEKHAEARLNKGRELVLSICSSCHTLDRIAAQHLNTDEWRNLIKGMLSEGAAVTNEETDLMCEYLAKHFGSSRD